MTDANTFYNRGETEGSAYQQGKDATAARIILERDRARTLALQNAQSQAGNDLVTASTPNADGSYNYGPPSTAPGMPAAPPAPPPGVGVAMPPAATPDATPGAPPMNVAGAGRGVVNPPNADPAVGGSLLDQSPKTQAAILRDAKKRGAKNFTVNGIPPGDASAPAAPVGTGVNTTPDAPPAPLSPDQLPSAPAPTGGVNTAPTRGDALRAMARAHFAYGGEEAGHAHLAAAKNADAEDAYNQGVNDPSFHPADLMKIVNGQPGANQPGHPHLTLGVVNGPADGVGSSVIKDSHGKDTQYALTVTDPSGQAYTSVHKENVLRKINGFTNMMKVDPQRALAGLGEVDAHLAALYATALQQQLEVQKGNTAAVGASEHNESYGVMAEARMQAANAAMDRAQAYGLRIEAGKTPKEMDPDDVTKLNTMSNDIADEKDPKKREALEGQYRRFYGVAAAKIGKVVDPGIGKAPKEVDPAKMQGAVESYIADRNSQDPDFKKLPYNAKRAAAVEAVGGQSGGGLPNPYGGGPGAPTPGPAVPAAAPFNPTGGAAPDVRGVNMGGAPAIDPSVGRIAKLRSDLQADDQLKAGGLSGIGGRMVSAGRLPMAMAERMQAEEELKRLQGGK